jgi:hypothetical protein
MIESHQFFNFAALVIPVLLFGGAVSDRWNPKEKTTDADITDTESKKQIKKLALLVWGAMVLALVAEVIAIIAAFGGVPEKGERIAVGAVMVAGTVAAAGAVAWPWLARCSASVKRNAIVAGIAVGGLLTVLLLVNTAGTPAPDSQPTKVEKELLRVVEAQKQSTTRLAELAKETATTQVTLRTAIRVLAADHARHHEWPRGFDDANRP